MDVIITVAQIYVFFLAQLQEILASSYLLWLQYLRATLWQLPAELFPAHTWDLAQSHLPTKGKGLLHPKQDRRLPQHKAYSVTDWSPTQSHWIQWR